MTTSTRCVDYLPEKHSSLGLCWLHRADWFRSQRRGRTKDGNRRTQLRTTVLTSPRPQMCRRRWIPLLFRLCLENPAGADQELGGTVLGDERTSSLHHEAGNHTVKRAALEV
jgi:hypothetical protein